MDVYKYLTSAPHLAGFSLGVFLFCDMTELILVVVVELQIDGE